MPRLMSIGPWPAATRRAPSLKIAWASTVAVVVPSPATSEVLEATSFTICAPMFWSLSSSSISLATVTPSLVIVGEPHDFSRMTLRPRGPSVTFTVLASRLSPCAIALRACCEKMMSLAAMGRIPFLTSSVEHGEDVVFAHDEVFGAVDLDFVAGVLGEQDLV